MRHLSVLLFLAVQCSAALADPGHGALEIHWHPDDLVWAALGALALAGIGLLVGKWLKR